MIAESDILVTDCSTSTDELDDLICHKPDYRPFIFRFAFLTFSVSLTLIPILILIPWPSGPLTFSFSSEGPLTFDLCLFPS